ncbi:MAG: ABC transporter substrate-binding protein [Myxococcota bacterium]
MPRTYPALLILALAIAPSGASAAEPLPHIVVLTTQTARPYELALDAIRTELEDKTTLTIEALNPDRAGEAERITKLAPDLLLTVGSQATIWAGETGSDVPIVFAMVLNPVSSGLVESMARPGGRITGASLDVPLAVQFSTLRALVGAERVAVLYDPKETDLVIRAARRIAERQGIELVPIRVEGPAELDEALTQLDDSLDALWSVADRTIFAHGAVERVLLQTLHERLPFMGLSEPYVRAGALFALTTSFEENGRHAAVLVERVLAGEPPAKIAIAVPEQVEIVFNPLTAERIGFERSSATGLALRELR